MPPLVRDWLLGYLHRYRALIGPPDWPDGTDRDESMAFTNAWLTQLGKLSPKATEAEADAALERLVLEPPQFRRECIPAVVKAILAMRREAEAGAGTRCTTGPGASETSAAGRSAGCPECTRGGRPTGWAERLAKWHSIRRPYLVRLACRCPLGRFRKAAEPDAGADDLQARPELWHDGLDHPSWSDRPCPPDAAIEALDDGRWRYVVPGEATPDPIAPDRPAGYVLAEPTGARP